MALTPKQQRFVEEYLVDLNATQAAIRAGYSPKTAEQQGSRLLGNAKVAAAVSEAQAARSERTEITSDWVLTRLADEADADLADLYDEGMNLKPVHDWPEIWRKGLVAGVDVEELFEGRGEDRERIGTVRKLKLSDRVRRIELIGKHVNVQAFREQVNATGSITVNLEGKDAEL
ncbi:terminase small subunit [Vannielia litorea]|uniref:terminase small subunit n=1 Tax=Vannielia litorea TaxID=1217970 RepID=UPI001BCD2D94|nr:terminase small subunit [Vannielia litorea]MBS8227112.1 terminase small subunit [Vannielia litorea]